MAKTLAHSADGLSVEEYLYDSETDDSDQRKPTISGQRLGREGDSSQHILPHVKSFQSVQYKMQRYLTPSVAKQTQTSRATEMHRHRHTVDTDIDTDT